MNDKCAKSIYAPNVNLRVLNSSLIRLATSFKFFPMMPKLKLISTKVILERNICEKITVFFIFFHYLFWKRIESYFRIKVSPIYENQQKNSLENQQKYSSENENQQKFSSLNDDQQTFLPEKFNDNQPTENENQQKFSPENENQQKISPENENQQKISHENENQTKSKNFVTKQLSAQIFSPLQYRRKIFCQIDVARLCQDAGRVGPAAGNCQQ